MNMSTRDQSASKGTRVYKVVILGDGGVGKSALVMQYVCHRFPDYHDPTIEDAYQQQARIDGEPARLDILDTAGQPEFTAMREQYMRKGEGFALCYSITDRRSFDEIVSYKDLIDRVRNHEDIPFIITGNKCDLEENRKVSAEDGAALARQYGVPFFETSAAWRQCVDDVFHGLVREIRQREKRIQTADRPLNQKGSRLERLRTFIRGWGLFHLRRSQSKT